MGLAERVSRGFWELFHALDNVQVWRKRRTAASPGIVVGAALTFTDGDGKLIATVWPDEGTKVHQPDKIRAAGDALVEHLAEAAAREAAEKEFGSAP
ncbi:hypothetical protein AB0F17_08480 [Nonomuraea sp. NPDC026600]|uniref:hypothetical protein n=1 Tax=Nonomuraea sp. NPDC026600 TaxID=3155363 RepID=UPI0033E10950